MKKNVIFVLIFSVIIFQPLFADFDFDDLFYSEFSINYSTIISPSFLENNSTGTLDTPFFTGKAGVNILKLVNIYTGLSFAFFVEQANKQHHYSFVPVYAGIKLNLFSDFVLYPSFYFEAGKSFSNYHFTKINMSTMSFSEDNKPWVGDYYNIGFSINWNVNDIFTFSLNIERPWLSYYEEKKNEIHIFNSGISFKILY